VNTNVTIPMSYVDDETNFINHSLYTGDPHEDLFLQEFRIYNGALSASDVALSQTLGPSALLPASAASGPTLTVSVSGGNIIITWPTSVGSNYALYSNGALGSTASWPKVGVTPTTVGQNFQVSVPITGAAQFYVLKN
jgi:hypothetical protein